MAVHLQRSSAELKNLFYAVKSRKDIAALLEIPEKQLTYHLYKAKLYKKFTISKKRETGLEIHPDLDN